MNTDKIQKGRVPKIPSREIVYSSAFLDFRVGHFHYTVRLFLGGHESEVFLQLFNHDFTIFESDLDYTVRLSTI